MESGINALSEYTMINNEKSHYYTMTNEELKNEGHYNQQSFW